MPTNEEDDDIEIGPVEQGVPLPRVGGFLVRLQRELQQLPPGARLTLLNVSFKQERNIRSRMGSVQKNLNMQFSVRVGAGKGKRDGKRTLYVWRTE